MRVKNWEVFYFVPCTESRGGGTVFISWNVILLSPPLLNQEGGVDSSRENDIGIYRSMRSLNEMYYNMVYWTKYKSILLDLIMKQLSSISDQEPEVYLFDIKAPSFPPPSLPTDP